MARRVEEHPEGGTGLVLVLGSAQSKHLRLGGVKVVDDHVDMHLLGYLLSRPCRRGVVLTCWKPMHWPCSARTSAQPGETSVFQSSNAP